MKSVIPVLSILLCSLDFSAAQKVVVQNVDLTKGEKIPAEANHYWTLGATGVRGWIFCDKLTTLDARQIGVHEVTTGSPADGVLQKGDAILGVGGKPFSYDPRTEFGKALTQAESNAGKGELKVTRWREEATEEVTIKLPVLGDYSATAPYNCPKSKLILEQGCAALAKRIATPGYDKTQSPVSRALNGLALLASGNPEYLPIVKREAEWAASFSNDGMQTWYYGYVLSFLAEYKIATGDESIMPGLTRIAMEAANGQSIVGSWGHKFARPDGGLYGYGMMNAPGVPLTTSLVLARAAGLKDPALDLAIDRSTKLLRFYTGKGSIPYGDHDPWIQNHDDNGKNGMSAVLFNLLGETNSAEYFSRMSLACHGGERDTGHTGNFWNMAWAMPGVVQSGPNATGAWMKEFGSWYYDLARNSNLAFPHQGPPELKGDSTKGWDSTGAFLLAYAMPLKHTLLTGKNPSKVPQLTAAQAQSIIIDGRGWNNKDRNSAYDQMDGDELIEKLSSWSPVVRDRAAMALAIKKDTPIPVLVEMLKSENLNTRLGACVTLGYLKGKAVLAIPALQASLKDKDSWMRIKASEALAGAGQPGMVALPELLEIIAKGPTKEDPRGMEQRFISSIVFGQMLKNSLDGVDREKLYAAIRAGLKNEDGRARGSVSSIYKKLSTEEIQPLLPAILQASAVPSPSGEMFADQVRIEGLKILASHHVEEGIDACVNYLGNQNPWASQVRTPEILKILMEYGTHAKATIPVLTQLADTFSKGEPAFPKNLSLQKEKDVRDAITKIEASTETPTLIKIKK
jgi:HEAT repeat protein